MSSIAVDGVVNGKFPMGKGDLVLRSVDNVLFYVNKAVLENASSIFAAAKEVSGVHINATNARVEPLEPVSFAADATTLELLLMG